MEQIGITERGDAALDTRWISWINTGKSAILITKDPLKLFNIIKELPDYNRIIVHTTITGLGNTIVEPNVPNINNALEGYYNLYDLLGAEKVVLRIDPIIPTEKGFNNVTKILEEVLKHREIKRVRISFMDMYKHVKARFLNHNLPIPEIYETNFHVSLSHRKNIVDKLTQILGFQPEICSEPGLPSSGCISKYDAKLLNVIAESSRKGQRKECSCIANKRELLTTRNPCNHKCIYCYWKN